MIAYALKKERLLPIGLDVGHGSIKMIQLAKDSQGISVHAASKIDIDPAIANKPQEKEQFILDTLPKMLLEGGFKGKSVVSSLPGDLMNITSLRAGEIGDSSIEEYVNQQAAQRFSMDVDRDMINYIHAGNVHHNDDIKDELIIMAAKNEVISRQIEMIEKIGLRPEGLDAVPCALFRSHERFFRRQADQDRTTIFADIGSRFTTIVFGRGCEIGFIKQIPIGISEFNTITASKLDISPGQAEILRQSHRKEKQGFGSNINTALDPATRQVMVDAISSVAEHMSREIALCLKYYTVSFRGRRIEKAIFSGGGAYENILLNIFKRQLTVDIEIAQPLRGFDIREADLGSDKRGSLCEWAVATGLGLKKLNRKGGQTK